MTAAQLHADLSRRGIYLWAEAGKLRFRAAPGALTADLKKKIGERRQELLALLDSQRFGSGGTGAPRIVPDPLRQGEPFPLTDVQQGYWLGRLETFDLAATAHLYVEIETPVLDPQRLELAWNRLVQRHPMLRAVVLESGHQQVLATVPRVELPILDLRRESFIAADDRLQQLRQELSQRGPGAEQWPPFDLRLSRRPGGERIHLSISLLICDATSWRLLLRQVSRLYFLEAADEDSEAPPELAFRDYVLAQVAHQESADYRRSLDFWRRRLAFLPPPPPLPLARSPRGLDAPRFVRRHAILEPRLWQSFQQRARQAKVTPTVALATAYAATLAAWSGATHFLLNLLFFNRLPWHPQVDEVVGNFSSTILLEVSLLPSASFESNAQALQKRLFEDLNHAQVSGVQVLRELQSRRGGSRHAAVPVVFASTLRLDGKDSPAPAADDGAKDNAIAVEVVHSALQTPQVWLDHQVSEREGALAFNWDVVSQLFEQGVLRDRFEDYFDLLWQLADEENAWDARLVELVEDLPSTATNSATNPATNPATARPPQILPPALATGQQKATSTPPRDAVEENLVRIWQELLQIPQVGIHDNFFERGGQSLMAVRMLARIHRELGRDLPMSVLFEGGTIAHLAEALRGAEHQQDSPLVAIQSEGEGEPFFCVHPVGGSVLCYQPLARALGKDRPFYGLQSLPAMEGWTLEAMAERYVVAVREVQPQGPYLLGGWSFGAVAAFEMARQLGALGEEVRHLAMIDVAPANLHDRAAEADASFLLHRFGNDLAALSGLDGFDPGGEDLPALARRLAAAGVEMAQEFAAFERLFETFGSNYRALLAYVPGAHRGAYRGRISMFQGLGGAHAQAETSWRSVVEGEIQTVGMVGDHYSLLVPPGVVELARNLRSTFAPD